MEPGPVLSGTDFEVEERYSLESNRPVRRDYEEGYRYRIVSSATYLRYVAEPERDRDESQFMRDSSTARSCSPSFSLSTSAGNSSQPRKRLFLLAI